jgi:hypothetical protein
VGRYEGDIATELRRPDGMYIPCELFRPDAERGHAEPHEVPLIVQVTEPSTFTADAITKVGVYAAWGIPLYLRLDIEPETVLYEYRLSDDGRYGEPTLHTDEFRTDEPFPLVISLEDLQWRD